MGVINLAHGSFYMIGAYLAYSLAPVFGGNFAATLLAGLVLAVIFGYALEWLFVSYLYERDHLQQVLMTYGLILVFEELRSILVDNDVHGVPVPAGSTAACNWASSCSTRFTVCAISAVCLVVAAGLYVVIARTRLGMMVRAGSSNREMVQSLGINIKFLYRVVFAAGVALAVLAGMIAAARFVRVSRAWARRCLSSASSSSSSAASARCAARSWRRLLVGIVDTFGKVLFPEAAGIAIYLLMAAILLWKPEGLFRQG